MSDRFYCSCGRDSGEDHKPYCNTLKSPRIGQGVSGYSELATLRAKLTQVEQERELLFISVTAYRQAAEFAERGARDAEQDRDRLAAEVEKLKTKEPGKLIAEIEAEYAAKTNQLIERHAVQLTAAQEENKRLEVERDELRAEVERLKSLYEQWGYADAPCPKHSKPSLFKEDCAVCRAEKAETQLTAAQQSAKEGK